MSTNYKKLGEIVKLIDERNKDEKVQTLIGVSIEKCFIKSVANTIGTDLSKYQIIRKNDFACSLMQVSRDGKIPIACLKDYDEAIMSPAYYIFRIKNTDEVLPDYLSMWFMRSEFDREAAYIAVGGVRGSMPWEDFCNMELPIPDIKEQQKIVDAYNSITKRIQIKQKINENLEKICYINYEKLLIDQKDNLFSGKIGDYAKVKSGYAFKSEWWNNIGYKVIKIGNITNNTIDLESCAKVSEENIYKSSEFFVKTGDLLIAMTGATTGKIGIVPLTNEIISVNQRTGKFFIGNEPLEKVPYLFSMMQSQSVRKKLTPDGSAGSAQDNLSSDDIQNIDVIYPNQKEIDIYNKKFKPLILKIVQNHNEISKLAELKQLVISRISGM